MIKSNLEQQAQTDYNQSSMVAHAVSDNVSHDLFNHILKEEEEHMNFFLSQLRQIEQMGLENYLASQI